MEATVLSRSPVPTRSEPLAASASKPDGAQQVRTEQVAAKAVEATRASEDARNETAGQSEQAEQSTEARLELDRRTILDSDTNTLLFQAVNQETGEVKRQIPEDVLLNVREYAREFLSTTKEPAVSEEA